MTDKSWRIAAAIVLACAIAIRVARLIALAGEPEFYNPTIDPLYHDAWATAVADGKLIAEEPFFRAPLYPYTLGAVYAVFGHSYTAARLLGLAIGTLTVLGTILLGRRLFGCAAGLIAGTVIALSPTAVHFDLELLVDPLAACLSVWSLAVMTGRLRSRTLRSGLLLGAAIITRPTALAFAPALLYWLWKNRDVRLIRAVAIMTLGIVLPVVPVAVHNVAVSGRPVLVATQGGINFYIGNNPDADGMSAVVPEFGPNWQYTDVRHHAEVERGRKLAPDEVSSYWYGRGLSFWLDSPGLAASLLAKKALLYIGAFEVSNNGNLYFVRRGSVLLRLLPFTFGVVAPLGICGFLLGFRTRKREATYLLLGMLGCAATTVAFFITARFRLPVLPLLAVAGAFAVHVFYERIRAKRFVESLAIVGIVGVLAIGVNTNYLRLDRHDYDQAWFARGNALLRAGKLQEAEEAYNRAAARNPRLLMLHLNLGLLAYTRGDLDAAEREFRTELENDPRSGRAANNLGVISQKRGRYAEAASWYERATTLSPTVPDGYLNAASLALSAGDTTRAVAALRSGRSNTGDPTLSLALGTLYARLGHFSEAIETLEESYRLTSGFVRYDLGALFAQQLVPTADPKRIRFEAAYNLGQVSARTGDLPNAVVWFLRAVDENAESTDARANLGVALLSTGDAEKARAELEIAHHQRPGDPTIETNLASACAACGDHASAISHLETVLSRHPGYVPAIELQQTLTR